MGTFYGGKDEFRWNFLTSGQGHYDLHKNLKSAIDFLKRNKLKNEPIVVQMFKPKRGKYAYVLLPRNKKLFSKNTIISMYKDKGYDVSFIRSKKYKLM